MAPRQLVDDQKAGVVARGGVLGAGVAQTDDEQLDRLSRRRRATRPAGRERLLLGLGFALADHLGLGQADFGLFGLLFFDTRSQH